MSDGRSNGNRLSRFQGGWPVSVVKPVLCALVLNLDLANAGRIVTVQAEGDIVSGAYGKQRVLQPDRGYIGGNRSAGCGVRRARYRARQIYSGLYRRRLRDWDSFTDLARPLREKLRGRFTISYPETVRVFCVFDGTRRYLFQLRAAEDRIRLHS